jgi:hypothetical protein
MKKACWTFILVLTAVAQAIAQLPYAELGFSSGMAFKAGKNDWDIPFAIRCGVYLGDGFMIEPEVASSLSPMDGAQMLDYGNDFIGANIQYILFWSQSVSPFILLGYGFSPRLSGTHYPDMLEVLELGCGVKFWTDEAIGLRLEYRRRNYSTVDVQFDALMVGLDVYF